MTIYASFTYVLTFAPDTHERIAGLLAEYIERDTADELPLGFTDDAVTALKGLLSDGHADDIDALVDEVGNIHILDSIGETEWYYSEVEAIQHLVGFATPGSYLWTRWDDGGMEIRTPDGTIHEPSITWPTYPTANGLYG